MTFYRCALCGQIVGIVKATEVPLVCCGEEMEEIRPNTVDASSEKHVPVITIEGNTVTVTIGSRPHPMSEEHHIEWIALETSDGNQRKECRIDSEPKACFRICGSEKIIAAYAYCNLHGLWKSACR